MRRLGFARAAALLLGVLALGAGSAAAHGQSITVTKDTGPYHVIFYTFDQVSPHEIIRFAWNVTDVATHQQRIHIDDPQVTVTFTDAKGSVASTNTTPLQQRLDGFLFADLTLGDVGKVAFHVPLNNGTAADYEQPIYPVSMPGPPGPPPSTPGPSLLAGLGALGLAASLLRRTR